MTRATDLFRRKSISADAKIDGTPMKAPALQVLPKGYRMGSPGTAIYDGRIYYEEFNKLLENDRGFGRYSVQGIYDKMRKTDPQIQRSLKLLKLPIRSARWIIEPGMNTPEGREHADFVSYNLFERMAWDQVLSETLTLFEFGFSLLEAVEATAEVYSRRFPNLQSNRGPGRPGKNATVSAVVYSSFELRPAKTVYRWFADPTDPLKVKTVQQMLPVSDTNMEVYRWIPGDRLIRFTLDQEAQNFQGVPVLRPVYKPWYMKDQLERLDAIRHERQNVGVPMIELPPGADNDAIDKADLILSHLSSHEQGYVTLPPGWKLTWLTSSTHNGTDVNESIERLKRDIADNIMAGFMTLGSSTAGGSNALAHTQADQYLLNCEAHSRYIEDTWNHGHDGWSPIKRIIDLNYGPQEKYPRLKATNLRSRDYGQILPLVAELVRFGAITPTRDLENFIRSRLELPANYVQAEEEIDETSGNDRSHDPTQKDVANPDKPLQPPIDHPKDNETTKSTDPESAPVPKPGKGSDAK